MKPDMIYKAVGDLDDGILAEAEAAREAPREKPLRAFVRRWGTLAAAILIAAGGILYGWTHRTVVTYATYVAEPYLAGPNVYPNIEEFTVEDYLAWREETDERITVSLPDGDFAERSMYALFGASDGGNLFYSPYNAELSLVSLADITAGATRAELLDVAGETDLTDFENRMTKKSRTIDRGDAVTILKTGGDLYYHFYYPDDVLSQGAETLDPMYNRYKNGDLFPFFVHFVSAIGGGVGSSGGKQTFGNGLENIVREYGPEDRIELDRYLYIRSAWLDPADLAKKRTSTFSGKSGECEADYVVAPKAYSVSGEGFTAVRIPLLVGGDLWLALPDEGKSPESLLVEGTLFSAAKSGNEGTQTTAAVPCFSVASEINLKDLFTDLGASKAFEPGEANLSPLFGTETKTAPDESDLIVNQSRLTSMQMRAEDIVSRTEDYFQAISEAGASRPEDEEEIRRILKSLADIIESEKERLEDQLREMRQAEEDEAAEKKYAVTHVLQPIRLMVDESGVKTAAYRIATLPAKEEAKKGVPDASVIVNRPFAVLITAEDGTILLAGAVNDIAE